jgi:NAD(P)-dependent dehydrogenase (short-subunit alcohol dehydrogenase family)
MTGSEFADLRGRTAVVTGAGNGIGRAIAVRLASRGARVVLVGRDRTKLASVLRELDTPGRLEPADVSDESSVARLAAALTEEDVSILVNNAGVAGPVASLWSIDVDEWDQVFDVNVRGVFLMCRAFAPRLIERGDGDILNIASVTGKRPLPRRTPYAASKMAVIGLTGTLAHELGPLGVRANTLSPGPVAGPRMALNFSREAERTGTTPEEAERQFVSRAALGRMVTEDEVADSALAVLCMRGLTGADVDLSGGMIAR